MPVSALEKVSNLKELLTTKSEQVTPSLLLGSGL